MKIVIAGTFDGKVDILAGEEGSQSFEFFILFIEGGGFRLMKNFGFAVQRKKSRYNGPGIEVLNGGKACVSFGQPGAILGGSLVPPPGSFRVHNNRRRARGGTGTRRCALCFSGMIRIPLPSGDLISHVRPHRLVER